MRAQARLLICGILLIALAIAAVRLIGQSDNTSSPLLAQAGVMDATDWSLNSGQLLPLDGQWQLYWNQLLTPRQIARHVGQSSLVEVPRTWKPDPLVNLHLSDQGYATYHLVVRLKPSERGQTLGLYMPSVATSYRLWIDNHLAASNGVVGTSATTMVPKNYPKLVYFSPDGTNLSLTIQVSNFVQRKGGLWQSLQLGTAEAVTRARTTAIAAELSVFACLLFMGLYHVMLFATRPKDQSSLYFGLLCLVISARTVVLGQVLLVYLWPDLSWQWTTKVEYWTAILVPPLIVSFLRTQVPRETSDVVHRLTWAFGIALALGVLATPAIVYTHFLVVVEIYDVLAFLYIILAFILALFRRRAGAPVHLIGILIFFLTVVNDALFYDHVFRTLPLTSFGLLAMLCIESSYLGVRLSRSFDAVARLSADLRRLNSSLEAEVDARTEELRLTNAALTDANHHLRHLEASRRRLTRDISHEIGNPLTAIRGYVQAILDGFVKSDDAKILGIIHNKATLIEHVVEDLIQLSEQEAESLPYRFQTVEFRHWMEGLFARYAPEMTVAGTTYSLGWRENTDVKALSTAIDPTRVEQVYVNIIENARRFTPAGGHIDVQVEFWASVESDGGEGRVVVTVSNDGPPLPDGDPAQLFRRFYRGHSNVERAAGQSGLGLAIAKEIVVRHGGDITAYNVPHGGCAFQFWLPAAESNHLQTKGGTA